jgi:hypothetical protein
MNDDPHERLARFRRKPLQISSDNERQQLLSEHEALKLAITALNEVPNSKVRMENYTNTYKLIPDLEKAYRAGEERTKLEELAPRMYKTLLLCEDVLSELGRLDDGTPSISALIDIRAIQKEAGNLSEEQVIKLMQGIPTQAPVEQDIAGGKAQPEQTPEQQPSVPKPEQDRDLEPDL